jgi:hypothetical protein
VLDTLESEELLLEYLRRDGITHSLDKGTTASLPERNRCPAFALKGTVTGVDVPIHE